MANATAKFCENTAEKADSGTIRSSFPDGFACSFAEMTAEEKNAVSHRGRAVRKLADFLHETIERS